MTEELKQKAEEFWTDAEVVLLEDNAVRVDWANGNSTYVVTSVDCMLKYLGKGHSLWYGDASDEFFEYGTEALDSIEPVQVKVEVTDRATEYAPSLVAHYEDEIPKALTREGWTDYGEKENGLSVAALKSPCLISQSRAVVKALMNAARVVLRAPDGGDEPDLLLAPWNCSELGDCND